MRRPICLLALALSGFALGACSTAALTSDPLAGQRLAAPPIDYSALLTHPDRPLDDFKDDAARKPAEVLEFVGLDYGMTIIEIEAGSGYYTELLSYAVGADGKVYMQNPASFDALFGDAITARLDNRLANVQPLRTNFDELTVPDGSADLVTWFLGPHELWFRPDGTSENAFGDPDKAFAEIVRVLKPGGEFVAIDHAAPAGAPPETGSDTHRIDEAIVRQYAKAAGLELVATSDVFVNEDDEGTASVFDPALRRKTNRFILKFRKTGS